MISVAYAQTSNSLLEVSNALNNYYSANIPALHLHINKTVYVAGENIGYTAYALDRVTDKITRTPYNVLVVLADKDHNEISKQLLYLKNGTANNSILLNPNLKNGVYYIKAFTPSMNTLNIDTSYNQSIQIIGETRPNAISMTNQRNYDIQLQPEGGHYVEGVKNNVGIKITDQTGKSAMPKHITLTEENNKKIVSNILINKLGMARFEYIPKKNKKYVLELTIDSKTISKTLPLAEEKGIILKTNLNYNSGHLNVILSTNTKTLKTLEGDIFYMMLHKDDATKTYEVAFERNYHDITFQIPNKDLFPGINSITIFNKDKKPVLERIFFNHKSLKKTDLSISSVEKDNDTLTYRLLNKINQSPVKSTISISVLPENTIANMKRSSILANIYLKPYTEGHLENGNYYFDNEFTVQKKYELDLLLLNQGWSKYSWASIFNSTPSNYYDIEHGITLDGYVDPLEEEAIPKQVLLYSHKNQEIKIADIYNTNKFTFKNLIISNNSSFDLSLINEKGKIIQSNFFYTFSPKSKDRNSIHKTDITPIFNEHLYSEAIPKIDKGVEQLDEVTVNAYKNSYGKYFEGWDGWKIDSSNTSIGNLTNLISKYGYYKVWNGEDFSLMRSGYDRGGTKLIYWEPALIIDGLPYKTGFAQALAMEDIDEIYVNRTEGSKRHTFVVFTKKNWRIGRKPKTSKTFTLTHEGFAKNKVFYTPKYVYDSDSFENFGVLSWLPQLKTNANGYTTFSVYNPKNTGLHFFIEGFTEDGDPISKVLHLKQKKESGKP